MTLKPLSRKLKIFIVILYLLVLQQFADANMENLIEAYAQHSETELHLSLHCGSVLDFTNAIHSPLHCLPRPKWNSTFTFSYWFYEKIRKLIFALYADCKSSSPTKSLSMLQLLDKLDLIEDPHVHALIQGSLE